MSGGAPETGEGRDSAVRLRHRCAAEFVGTFALVFAGCGAVITGAARPGTMTPLEVSAVFGAVVAAMIYTVGPVSAAHFNPAVTLGFTVAGRFPRRAVLPYWAAQCAGAVSASGAHALLYGGAARRAGFGATMPWGSAGRSFGFELILTAFLMFAIMGVATDRRAHAATPGMAIGLTVFFDAAIGGPISGASMNPARSLGPALFAGGPALATLWLYLLAPCLGAVLAALAYEAVRGGERYAQAAPSGL